MRIVSSLVGVVLLIAPAASFAAVICAKKNGVLVIRDECKQKQTLVDISSFGAAGPKGDKGDQGEKGDKGDPGSLVATLPSGQTLTGVIAAFSENANPTDTAGTDTISFVVPLASDPIRQIIPPGGPVPPGCSGDVNAPQADPGNLCIFIGRSRNASYGCYRAENGTQGASRRGCVFYVNPIGAGESYEASGAWAVTAP